MSDSEKGSTSKSAASSLRDFVAQFPTTTPRSEIVAKANELGLKLTEKKVSVIRYDIRRNPKAKKAAAKKVVAKKASKKSAGRKPKAAVKAAAPVAAATVAPVAKKAKRGRRPKVATVGATVSAPAASSDAEVSFRKVVLRLGLDRARQLLAKYESANAIG